MAFARNFFLLILLWSAPAFAAEPLRIAGSSTVYPFAASVAEHFGKAGDFRTPIVEATGTGAGFKLFCSGIGKAYPYITNASRAMLPSERAECEKSGVRSIIEISFGFDGISLANSNASPVFHLTKKQLFLALAHDVPKEGKVVPNFYERWNQISPSLPDMPIKVYGMPPVSGTYDTFIELVMKKGCGEVKEMEDLIKGENERERKCRTLREDGRFIEAGENGNLITQKLISDPDALGILGFSFLQQNAARLHASFIGGSLPTFEAIQDGSYPLSRPLYFYVKADTDRHFVPGIREYVQEFTSEAAIGDEGYLVNQGLVPFPRTKRDATRKEVEEELK